MKTLLAVLATTAVLGFALHGAWRMLQSEKEAAPAAPPPAPPAPLPPPPPPPSVQDELLARFDAEEGPALERRLADLGEAPPLPRLLARLQSQERRERFLLGLLPPDEAEALARRLGPDPYVQLAVPVETLRAAPEDRAEALAAHWRRVLAPEMDDAALRGRAAAAVWNLDRIREASDPEDPRGLERRLLEVLVESESALATGKGSPSPLRFAPVSSTSP